LKVLITCVRSSFDAFSAVFDAFNEVFYAFSAVFYAFNAEIASAVHMYNMGWIMFREEQL